MPTDPVRHRHRRWPIRNALSDMTDIPPLLIQEQLVLGILVSLDHDYIGTWERPWRTPDVVASVVSLKTRGPLPCLSRHSLTLFAMFIDNESPLVFYQGNWASYPSVDLGMLGTVNGTMSAALDLDASASVFFLGERHVGL